MDPNWKPWTWNCPSCDRILAIASPQESRDIVGVVDGWYALRAVAVRHLRTEHHAFTAEDIFDQGEWCQGGPEPLERVDTQEGEPEPTEWDLDEACEMAKAGTPYAEIARVFGVSIGVVEWRVKPAIKARSRRAGTPAAMTKQQERRARRLLRDGYTMRRVAELVGISRRQAERIRNKLRAKGVKLQRSHRTPRGGSIAEQACLMFQ